ncbi:MAG: hypothetical protein AB1634_09135 [Thermodesulfobacteriota bacterium]
MDINIREIIPSVDRGEKLKVIPKLPKRERRKSGKDRRQSAEDAIVVTLSTRVERRSGVDRRKK